MAEFCARNAMKILFICTANVCRSPMAAALLNALAEKDDLHLRAESAGVAALVGHRMARNTAATLAELGVSPVEHHARQVDRTMVEDAEVVLTMGLWHREQMEHLLGGVPMENVHVLPNYAVGAPEWEEVPDPYGHTMTAHRATSRQLLAYIERLPERFFGR